MKRKLRKGNGFCQARKADGQVCGVKLQVPTWVTCLECDRNRSANKTAAKKVYKAWNKKKKTPRTYK